MYRRRLNGIYHGLLHDGRMEEYMNGWKRQRVDERWTFNDDMARASDVVFLDSFPPPPVEA